MTSGAELPRIPKSELLGRLPEGHAARTSVLTSNLRLAAALGRDFDAIFLGVGLGGTHSLGIPGEGHAAVVDALSFIEQLKTRPYGTFAPPARVLVIGGGNTAVDAANPAKRLSAQRGALRHCRPGGAAAA